MKIASWLLALAACAALQAEAQKDDVVERLTGTSAWVNLPEGDIPVADALRLVAEQSKRTLATGDAPLAGKTFHADGRTLTLLQALDEVSKAAGVAFDLDGADRISPSKDPQPTLRACYEGAFRVKLEEMSSSRRRSYRGGIPHSELAVTLRVGWEPHVHVIGIGSFEADEAIDDQGTDLLPREGPSRLPNLAGWTAPFGGDPSYPVTLRLMPPPAEARVIHSLRGSVGVIVERDESEISFDKPTEQVGQTRECEKMTLTLLAFKTEAGCVSVSVESKGPPPVLASCGLGPEQQGRVEGFRCTLCDANGKDLGEGSGSRGSEGADVSRCDLQWWNVGAGPFVVKLAIPMRAVRRDLRVEFRDLDLP